MRVSRTSVLILAGGLVSLLAVALIAARVYHASHELERLRIENDIDLHFAALSNHLQDRRNFARAVAAVFKPPGAPMTSGLADIDKRFLNYVPDITSMVWVPRVTREALPQVYDALRAAGIERPALLGPGRKPLETFEAVLYLVLDIEPKTPANLSSLGLVLSALPQPRVALEQAAALDEAIATGPLRLVQVPEVPAFVLYVPLRTSGPNAEGSLVGFLGFSYRYDRLIGEAVSRLKDQPFTVHVVDAAAPDVTVFKNAPTDTVDRGAASLIARELPFAGRTWLIQYRFRIMPPIANTLQAAALGAATVLLMMLVAGYVARINRRLEGALQELSAADDRLRIVVRELNHRLKNVLTLVQALARRTFRDADIASASRSFLGRIGAMARAADVLIGSERVALRDLIVATEGGGERITVEGPDLWLTPVGAQNIALLIYELWTNSMKYGALSVEAGHVQLTWGVAGDRFTLQWVESGGPAVIPPTRRGFGAQLIETIVPQALGGRATARFLPDGFRYDLDAAGAVLVADAPSPAR